MRSRSWPTSACAWTTPSPATSSASTTTASCKSATPSPRARSWASRAFRISRRSCFCSARPRDPIKAKQLQKGLRELGEEGAIQKFEKLVGGDTLLGAVGQLQFEVVAQRLQSEYKVDALVRRGQLSIPRAGSRFRMTPRGAISRNSNPSIMARDVDGNLVYLAANRHILQIVMEEWPTVTFHTTREHGQRTMPSACSPASLRPQMIRPSR